MEGKRTLLHVETINKDSLFCSPHQSSPVRSPGPPAGLRSTARPRGAHPTGPAGGKQGRCHSHRRSPVWPGRPLVRRQGRQLSRTVGRLEPWPSDKEGSPGVRGPWALPGARALSQQQGFPRAQPVLRSLLPSHCS